MAGMAPVRLMLVAALTCVGVVAEATASPASAPNKHAAGVAAKKKPKKATVKVADSDVGKILVAADGRSLYAFDVDGGDIDASKCEDSCAQAWPPLLAKGKPKAGKGLDKDQLVVGESGQIAYGGHLLYKFSGDEAAGDTNGQGVGDVWHLVDPNGDPIL